MINKERKGRGLIIPKMWKTEYLRNGNLKDYNLDKKQQRNKS